MLCQVDLAVIIVNNNNNSVYEFSSGNVSSILDKHSNAPSIHRDSSFSGDYDENGKFHKRNMSQHEDTDSDQESSFHDIKRHRALSPNMTASSKQTYSQNFTNPNPNYNLVNKFGYVNSQQQNMHLMPNNQNYITNNNAAAADSVFAAAAAVSSSMNNNSNINNPVNNRFNQYQKLPMVSSKLGQFEASNNNNTQNSLGIYSNDTTNGHLNMQTSTPNLNQNAGPNGTVTTAGTLLSASSSASSSFLIPTPAASMNPANNPISKINTNVPAFNSPYNNSTATFSSIASPSYTNRSTPSSARPVLKVQIPVDKDAKKPDMSSSNSISTHNNTSNITNTVGAKLPILEEYSTGEKIPISATLPSALFLPLGSSSSKDNSNKQPPTAGLMSSTIRPLLFGGNNSTSSLNNSNNSNSNNNNINGGEQTPVSGFPLMSARFGDGSRYMNEFFPSPLNYYGEWNVPNANTGGNGVGTGASTSSASNAVSGNSGLSGGDSETPVKLVSGVPLGTSSSMTNAEHFGVNKDSVLSSSLSTASGNNAAIVKKEDGPSTASSTTVFSGPMGTIGGGVVHNGSGGVASSATNGPSLNTLHNNGSSSSDLLKHSLNNPNGLVKDELPSPIGFPLGLPFGKLKRGDTSKNDS